MEYKYASEVAAELKTQLESGKEEIKFASQHQTDIEAWSYFLRKYVPRAIIELGTGDGTFSEWLSTNVEWFRTFDIGEPLNKIEGFKKINIFDNKKIIEHTIQDSPFPLVLFCDNGDKPREVELFSPFLGPHDFLAVHDYQIEISGKDVPREFDLIYNYGLTAFFQMNKQFIG